MTDEIKVGDLVIDGQGIEGIVTRCSAPASGHALTGPRSAEDDMRPLRSETTIVLNCPECGGAGHVHIAPAVYIKLAWTPGDRTEVLQALERAVADVRKQVEEAL